jgi:hypothetical protein
MTRRARYRLLLWAIVLLLAAAVPTVRAADGCHSIPITSYSPTGVAGCPVYGEGIASMWGGPGAARNDCTWPFKGCQPIAIRSLDTGLVITITPTMYCDCYTTTPDQRMVDLDPAMVAALGLDPAAGLFPVSVYPVDSAGLPNTAMTGDPR